jgi:dGTPase
MEREVFNELATLDDKADRYDNTQPDHPIRSRFQRDRDRILYSRAFRRLNGKTQVFLAAKDDHVRNRLTHTLEVNQIAQTISKELGLNLELTEAIALGHDLGHTPFGHVGERTLNHIMNGCYKIADFNDSINENNKGFKHNLQGVRVAKDLEQSKMNLTKEVLWGILHHSKLEYKECKKENGVLCDLKHNNTTCVNKPLYHYNLGFYDEYIKDLDSSKFWTIEGLIVSMADEIAQRHHDIEDAIEFNILSIEVLVYELEKRFKDVFRDEDRNLIGELKKLKDEKNKAIGVFSKLIVDFLTTKLIENTRFELKRFKQVNNIENSDDFYKNKSKIFDNKVIENLVSFPEQVKNADKELQEYLRKRILNSFEAQRMDGLGQYVIRKLFEAYTYNPQQLPDRTMKTLYTNICHMIENEEKKYEDNKYQKIKRLLEYDKYKKNKEEEDEKKKLDVGEIRNIISALHYHIYDEENESSNLYNNVLLRTICDYIAGMTDKYALEEHKKLYNC